MFASYLCHELQAMRPLGDVEILVNDNNALLDTNGDNIVVLDLDSSFADIAFFSENIIGFSIEDFINDKKRKIKCISRLIRPFNINDLLNIVSSMLKNERYSCLSQLDSQDDVDDEITFLNSELAVKYLNNTMRLSRNEYNILELLDSRRGETITRDEIKNLLGSEHGNMCDVYVCRLRAKFAEISNKKMIYTVRNKGYTLK